MAAISPPEDDRETLPLVSNSQPSSPIHSRHKMQLCGLSQVVIAIIASLSWMAVSSGLIMLNKDILSHGFPYPMTLSGLGMLFSSVASYFTCRHFNLGSEASQKRVIPHFYATKILPVGFCMAVTLLFGNLVYLHLTVSFIQILKSFTPVITMVALFIAGLEIPTQRLILSVTVIAAGTAIASLGEGHFSILGLVIMLTSEAFEAIRLVMTQLLLTGLKFHPIEGLMYLAPACTFWLCIGAVTMELRPMVTSGAVGLLATHPTKFCAAAVMGFLVNSLAYVVIQTASSLTLKVLGTVKNAFVVWCGIFFLGESVSGTQGLGYALSVAAFYWYQRIKMEQIRKGEMDGGVSRDVHNTSREDGIAMLRVVDGKTDKQ